MNFHAKLVKQVEDRKFIVVCDGITDAMVPGLDVAKIPKINEGPFGPHTSGSLQVRFYLPSDLR